jgi:hypothetical protein
LLFCLWHTLSETRGAIESAMTDQLVRFFVALPFSTYWTPSDDGLIRDPASDNLLLRLYQQIASLFDTAKPGRFRRCASELCGRVFYAARKDQRACSKKCSNALLQREWYARQTANPPKHQWGKPKRLEVAK